MLALPERRVYVELEIDGSSSGWYCWNKFLRPPALDLRQFHFRPLGDDCAATEVDGSGAGVERQPVSLANGDACELRGALRRIDGEFRAADDARLRQLACDQVGVSSPPADCRQNPVGNCKVGNIRGIRVRPNEDHGVAVCRQARDT